MAGSPLARAWTRVASPPRELARVGVPALRTRIDDVRPTTAWRLSTSVLYSGIIAVSIVGLAVLLFGIKPSSPTVSTVSAAEIGDCVTVAAGEANPASCDVDAMNFLVAEKVPTQAACSLPSYARVATGGATLCVVPNLELGSCYQVRQDSKATTDITKVGCPSAVGDAAPNVVRVTQRASGAPLTCRGGAALNYTAPQRIGYCIAAAS